jgi:predicted ATPase
LYERVPAGQRLSLHKGIGEQEEQAYGDRAREIAAELAVHFERGRDYLKAVQYLQHAGENALRRSAHHEAIILLTRGLELLKTLPDTAERTQQELVLHIALGGSLIATKGYAAPEVERIYARARQLCQQVGETPQLVPALGGLWQFYVNRAEYQTVRELGEQLLTRAQRVQDPALRLVAHDALAQTFYCLGEFTQARSHLEQVISLYDPQQHRSLASLCGGEDPGVVCQSFGAWTLWVLGYPDQAFKRTHEALTLAQELSSPFNLALALGCAALLHQFRRERQATQELAEVAMTLCSEQRFALFLALGTILQGWALAEEGQRQEGIAQMRQGLTAYRATGEEFMRPYFLALLAEASGEIGQAEAELPLLAEALDTVYRTGERFWEAELYRLKGQLTLQSKQVESHKSKVKEAEACFLQAIEVARKQQAKSLELRAAMSLARLWQQQGKKNEAHSLLSEIYGWFTEGFDTTDLQEAKALLAELTEDR